MNKNKSLIFQKHPFLVIGAMKSGSTSIYNILNQVENIYMPANKEPNTLSTDKVYQEKEAYYKLIGATQKANFIGEASTCYTKFPDHKNIPKRALDILGSQTKIIYIVRDPLKRALSHINHDISLKIIKEEDARKALFSQTKYANYSDYRLQLKQWVNFFPRDNFLVIRFEDFINRSEEEINKILFFLGVPPQEDLNYSVKANASEQKLVPHPFIRWFIISDAYRNNLKRFIPLNLTNRFKIIFSNKAKSSKLELNKEEEDVFLSKCNGFDYFDLNFSTYLDNQF